MEEAFEQKQLRPTQQPPYVFLSAIPTEALEEESRGRKHMTLPMPSVMYHLTLEEAATLLSAAKAIAAITSLFDAMEKVTY